MRLVPLRLSLDYWPLGTNQQMRPAVELRRTPHPDCPHCEGERYVGDDPEGTDQTECGCAPWKPILALPLPRVVNSHYRRRGDFARSRAAARRAASGLRVCRFCGADNGPDARRCGFCNYDPRDL